MNEPLSSWTDEARAVVDRACDAYGGVERWRSRTLTLVIQELSGVLPALKGHRRTFHLPSRVEVTPSRGLAVFHDYPATGAQGRFEAGVVSLVGQDGREQVRAENHRASFSGTRKWRRWSPLDALYFFGYALTHYHSVPFSLLDARLVRHRPASGADGLDRLTVEFPPTVHTHGARQTYHFDREGLIRRHDYVAEIIGGWARGAHHWRDYVTVDGMPIARTRHVLPRLGITYPVPALHAELTPLGQDASQSTTSSSAST